MCKNEQKTIDLADLIELLTIESKFPSSNNSNKNNNNKTKRSERTA